MSITNQETTSSTTTTNRRRAETFDLFPEEQQQAEQLGPTTVSSATTAEEDTTSPASQHDAAMEEQTEHFLHLYSELTSNVFEEDSNHGKPIILSSLSKLDELLKANTTTVSRLPGLNVDTVQTEDGKYFLRCHLATLLDFSHYNDIPYKHSFEAAAAISLAAHHMNEGIGWIVPELTGLNQRCPIRFTTEFADTEYNQGVSLGHVIEMTDRVENKPCAFIGATKSTVSVPTAIVTGIRGYPQISTQSTSEQLDDTAQFPLFGRTVPSDVDNAVPIVRFFRYKLNATHLAVIHVNNGYGNAFADDLKFAAQVHAPDLVIEEHELSEHPNPQLITDVVHVIKESKLSYIFAALLDNVIDDVMEEAYRQGVAGNGIHNWFFSNTFADIGDRYFEKDSPLHHAYRGVGRMEVSGGHQGMASFDTFACNLRTLRSSPPDLDYLSSLLPQKEYTNTYDFGEARDFSKAPYIYDDDFLTPVPKMADRTSPAYEAAIALGLAACEVVNQGLPLTGEVHFEEFKRTTFKGVEAEVKFLNESGTRDPNTTLFAVENEVEEEIEVTSNGTTATMIKFRAVVSDIYDHGTWEHLEDYVFNDGTTAIQPDLVPPEDVVHHYIHTPLKIIAGLMFLFIMSLACRFLYWTETNKKQRVVRASQPLFLRVICIGVMIFASAIVPLNIDDRIASVDGCTIACNFYYWLFFMGFSIMFSGLFTKIYRVNQIMNNPVKFRRVKVTVKDVIKPMAAIIGVNFIVLIAMTAAAPSEWEIVVSDYDEHGRPTETYGHCTAKDQIPYYTTLGLINFAALVFSMQQAYNTRKLATEFSESRYIFYAMIGIVVALFQGIPVLILVRDSPDVQDFIKCTVIFVTSCSVLLFLFYPKMKFLKKQLKKTKSQRFDDSIKISGLDMSSKAPGQMGGSNNNFQPASTTPKMKLTTLPATSSLSAASAASTDTGSSEEGVRFTMKTQAELSKENAELRRKLNMKNVSLGTLKSESSVSAGSGGSSGMLIVARKGATELMQENKRLKKMLKQNKRKKATRTHSIEEEKQSECERPAMVKRTVSGSRVTFDLGDGSRFRSSSSLPALVMPTDSEGGISINSIDDIPSSRISAGDIEAAVMANNGSGAPTNHGHADTPPNSSSSTHPTASDESLQHNIDPIGELGGGDIENFQNEHNTANSDDIEASYMVPRPVNNDDEEGDIFSDESEHHEGTKTGSVLTAFEKQLSQSSMQSNGSLSQTSSINSTASTSNHPKGQ